ncbi:MAG: lipopolysaccharide biosynthesis protein, partial [Bacteroidales bacterium]|nr:lipopolysaccharide biosynthesis protein [Bacteroidales bacterium]
MLLLMLIGLFTSRIILKNLGADDYGIYNAVGGLVLIFTSVTASISTVISRFVTVGLAEGDSAKLKRIFSTSVVVQLILFGLLLLLIETVGVWFLNTRMDIPEGRMAAANIVLQCSAGTLLFQMLSVPFNAVIIAHERMNAFALLSILEGVLKISVAILIMLSPTDKLVLYAILMLVVSAIVRTSYATYCHRQFSETHSGLTFDRSLVKEMARFSGWNFLGASAQVFSPQGITLLTNIFFGVAMNAARAVALQVDNIVKQFAINVIIAINPQITKSYVSGSRDYSYSLMCKACKYSVLIILLFLIPLFFEADVLLDLWLDEVPEHAALFTRLTVIV